MNTINISSKIRQLRKKKGITQEVLASALSVTPQAVSKWESGLTYPDMEMIPIIAGYFEISLDMLFDYDLNEMKAKIKKIIDEAQPDFFPETGKYIQTIKNALIEYPGNETLTSALLDGYEYDLRNNKSTAHLDEMIELSQQIISESNDFMKICNVKEVQAAAYLEKGEYDKAKEVLNTLPEHVVTKNDTIAFRLHGLDKLNGAIWARCGHLQSLYQACFEEGNAWLEMNEKQIHLHDTPFHEYLNNAEKAFRKGLSVLETFILNEYSGQASYLWDGMQTFQWSFHQKIAACKKKMGDINGCEEELNEAYRIISTAWDDFETNREDYMKPYNQYLKELYLTEYIV